jgi:hypothetical protein
MGQGGAPCHLPTQDPNGFASFSKCPAEVTWGSGGRKDMEEYTEVDVTSQPSRGPARLCSHFIG